MRYDITTIFCCLDDFCKLYDSCHDTNLLGYKGQRKRDTQLSLSDMLTIMTIFHLSPCKNFKYFYTQYLPQAHKGCFHLVSYPRFVQLMPRLFMPFMLLVHCLKGEKTGIYIADATSLPVCHNKRIHRHKVFKNLAQRGKTTMGWFFGLKLHIVINHKNQIMAVSITPGNIDERKVLPRLVKGLKGKLFADRGYISKELFRNLYNKGLRLITGIRKNMKNHLMELIDKILLRKRFAVETLFGKLKVDMNLTHTRSRSPINFFVNILSCLACYQIKTSKSKIKLDNLIHN